MKLEVLRYSDNGESLLGLLFIDGKFECYTLEDEARTEKVWGETAIPDGEYKVEYRTVGGHHERYSKRFSDIHKGMLHVKDVPNFKYILIHIGNDDDDTAGCLLVGNSSISNQVQDGFVGYSTDAYKRLYKKVSNALEKNEKVTINYCTINGMETTHMVRDC